jgi:hypothetical protein
MNTINDDSLDLERQRRANFAEKIGKCLDVAEAEGEVEVYQFSEIGCYCNCPHCDIPDLKETLTVEYDGVRWYVYIRDEYNEIDMLWSGSDRAEAIRSVFEHLEENDGDWV